jgi:hypothetical protein
MKDKVYTSILSIMVKKKKAVLYTMTYTVLTLKPSTILDIFFYVSRGVSVYDIYMGSRSVMVILTSSQMVGKTQYFGKRSVSHRVYIYAAWC